MKLVTRKIRVASLHEEKHESVYNKVWEVTRMSWPEPFPEAMDRSRVKLIRAERRLSRNH